MSTNDDSLRDGGICREHAQQHRPRGIERAIPLCSTRAAITRVQTFCNRIRFHASIAAGKDITRHLWCFVGKRLDSTRLQPEVECLEQSISIVEIQAVCTYFATASDPNKTKYNAPIISDPTSLATTARSSRGKQKAFESYAG